VWEHISQVEQRTEERLATLCLTSLCGGRVKCGVACLNHLHALPEKQRYGKGYWKGCFFNTGNPNHLFRKLEIKQIYIYEQSNGQR
jgi:hypothetical protein